MILNEKKQKLPEIFLSTYISDAWDRIATLKADIDGIKAEYSDTKDVEEVLNDLIDTYLILVGTFENKLKSIGSNVEIVRKEPEVKKVNESVLQRTQVQRPQPVQPQVQQRPVNRNPQPQVQRVQPQPQPQQTRAPQLDDDLWSDAVFAPQNQHTVRIDESYNQQGITVGELDSYYDAPVQSNSDTYDVPDFPDSDFEMSQEELMELEKFKAQYRR